MEKLAQFTTDGKPVLIDPAEVAATRITGHAGTCIILRGRTNEIVMVDQTPQEVSDKLLATK